MGWKPQSPWRPRVGDEEWRGEAIDHPLRNFHSAARRSSTTRPVDSRVTEVLSLHRLGDAGEGTR